MTVYKNIIMYLKGLKFDNGLNIKYSKNDLIFKNHYLVELSKNKKILHIGFVDHLPLIDKKIKNNNWLHIKLIKVSNKCIGIDINEKSVNYLKDKYKIENIYSLDIRNDILPKEILNEKFDYLLLPDVIEHIGNPVNFLKSLKNKFLNVDKFVITTPNAFRWDNFKNNFKNFECINTDHRFWFTPYTISKILVEANFTLKNIYFAEHSDRLSIRRIIKNIIITKFPMFRDTLIVEAK